MDGWAPDGDRFILTGGSAVWEMPEGPLPYKEFRMSPGGVHYNVAPADIMRTSATAPSEHIA